MVGTAALLVGGFFFIKSRKRTEAVKRERQVPLGAYNKPELSGDGIRKEEAGMYAPGSRKIFELPGNETGAALEVPTESERPRELDT